MRNVTATIEKGKAALRNNWRLDISAEELQVFFDNFRETTEKTGIYEAIWETVTSAYEMGLAVGIKNRGNAPDRGAKRPAAVQR